MKSIIYVLALSLFSPYVYAGTESSGGGPSVFCPGSSSPEGTAQLYDFFEGRLRRGFNIPVTNSALKEDQAEWALRKLESVDYATAQDVRVQYQQIRKSISYLPDGILMTLVNDLGTGEAPLVPANCQLAYAGYFESTGKLSVARLLYDRFTETEKAALLIHEALYVVAREMTNQVDSRSTRILNAFLFSTATQPSDLVQKALATMQMQGFGLLIPVKANGSEHSLSIRASCGTPTNDKDTFHWGADVSLWSSSGATPYTTEGFQTPRLTVKKDSPLSGESVIPFNSTTKTIIFNNSKVYRSGICANENLELYYAGQKVLTIPSDSEKFTVRLFPQP